MVKEPRCPYCASMDDFMLMSMTDDGRFVCRGCGHVAVPDDKAFQCFCRHCGAMRAFEPAKARLWPMQKMS